MPRVIVVGTDGSPAAAAAVEWAADDAARAATGMRVVHVADRSPYASLGSDDSILADGEAVARKRQPGIDVTCELLEGAAAAVLRGLAADAAEIVIGGRGHGGFLGSVLGSVSAHVAGHAHGPVVVVRSGPDIVFGEIAVGLDDYRACEPALAYAFEQARLRTAAVRAVYAWLPPAQARADELDEIHAAQRRTAARLLQGWRQDYPQVSVIEDVRLAHPVAALVGAAEKADLVVVGSQGRGAIGTVMLGSITLGVLQHARTSVAVVRP
ncbi:universal stress protein [Nonomuraea sp. NPDC050536]|uniref:universal stress protein n=1 Tax=Nonomuraea sp. NPDC050536 TaxID=3364366 RepID=UPI0037C85497